jgi:hypothetical protein
MQHSNLNRGRGSLWVCVCVILIAACTQAPDQERIPAFAERDPHPSPFAERKVILSEESYSKQGAVAKTTPDLKIVVIAKNECVDKQCNLHSGSVSCLVGKHPERNPELKTQFFPITLSRPLNEAEIQRWVDEDPCIIGLANNQEYKSDTINDPYYASHQRAYLATVKYQESLTTFSPANLETVRVGVVDTGVGTHEDFGDATTVPGVVFRQDLRSIRSKEDPQCASQPFTLERPNHPHGTMIAGVIGATTNNSIGVAGVASNVQIYSYAVGNCRGQMSTAEIGNALLAGLQHDVEVVNVSLGGQGGDDPGLRFSLVELLNRRAVVAVSAGNSYLDLRTVGFYPANYARNYPGVISVAWGTPDGDLQHGNRTNIGSNFSPEHVKILAPGELHAVPTMPTGYATGIRGSSLSSPIVAGAAALTIGFLKKKKLAYDEGMIEHVITKLGVVKKDPLRPYVRDGAVLDMQKLGAALQNLVDTGADPRPIIADRINVFYNNSLKQQQVNFRLSWDLLSTNFGARLGIFDGRCGFSAGCIIQDFKLSGNTGTKDISLTRNDLLPTLPHLSDPIFGLYVTAAIYHKVYGSNGKAKNNFGTDAVTRLNLRDFDISTNASPMFSGVSSIRNDQKYLYVSGYACLQDSNKAVPVSIVTDAGTPIATDFAYFYRYMVPHGPPIDPSGSFGWSYGLFLTRGFDLMQKGKTAYPAGIEANPINILPCRTFTTAHGFEFGVPLQTILANSLQNKKFTVSATNPRTGAKLNVRDALGTSEFTFPEVNLQSRPASTVNINRSSDSLGVTGSICSQSPTPVQMEVSFSDWAFRCRLLKRTNFPSVADPCTSSFNGYGPLVHAASVTDRQKYFFVDDHTGTIREQEVDLEMTPAQLARHITKYPGRWPNMSISRSRQSPDVINGFFSASNIQDVSSGSRVGGSQLGVFVVANRGLASKEIVTNNLANRAGTSVLPLTRDYLYYWDYYDVGEDYTDSVIAYPVDISKTIGEYIFRTLGVRKVMRETKKYETPLGLASTFLSYESIPKGIEAGGTCGHRFSFNRTISNITSFVPPTSEFQAALLFQGESPLARASIDPISLVMQQIPLDIRFFQDGVMILHLLSDYQSNVIRLETLGRGQ